MAIQTIKLGGYVDEEVKKINDNFSEIETDYAKQTDIPDVPTNISEFTNDSGYQTATQVQTTVNSAVSGISVPTKLSQLTNDANYVKSTDASFLNKVDRETGKGLSTNDYTTDDKNKVGRLGKIDFTTSNFGTADAEGYYTATLSASGKYPVKVMRENSGVYEEVLVHAKLSGTNILLVSSEPFAGYVVTV